MKRLTDGDRDVIHEAERDARETEEAERCRAGDMRERIGKALAFADMHGVMTREEAEEAYIYVAELIDNVG